MTSDQINGICEFEPFTYAERQQLLVEWNNTRMEYLRWSCLHELFEAQVIRTPDATGIVFENEHITYHDLNVHANRLANHLRQLGVGPEVMVGLYIDHSVNAIIGILGILRAVECIYHLPQIFHLTAWPFTWQMLAHSSY